VSGVIPWNLSFRIGHIERLEDFHFHYAGS
jgi:hypothetical protein